VNWVLTTSVPVRLPTQLSRLEIAPRLQPLPTLVLRRCPKPYSHLLAGLPEVLKWIDLIRFFKADGSFHFIHARHCPTGDISIDNSSKDPHQFVLGQERLTVNQAIAEIWCLFKQKNLLSHSPSLPLANLLIVLFRIQMAAWFSA